MANKILVIDDEANIREGLRQALLFEGYQVELAENGRVGLEKLQKNDFCAVISDLKMPHLNGFDVLKAIQTLKPEVPVIIITGFATVDVAVEAMKNGAADYLTKPFFPDQIIDKVQTAITRRQINCAAHVSTKITEELQGIAAAFISKSPPMQRVFQRILQVAPINSTVLITGESGTEKELVARAIHNNSARKDEAFVAIGCNSVPDNILERELFGYAKGLFNGATQTKPGLFSIAGSGTLFLDEIASLSMATQAKLVGVLQQREVCPIGGTKATPIDIRLIVATNRGLDKMVETGTFRYDLYFRLNTIPIKLPPLRERNSEVPLLISYFLQKFSEDFGEPAKKISSDALLTLCNYSFPGNLRELENLIKRAVVLTRDDTIGREALGLPALIQSQKPRISPRP